MSRPSALVCGAGGFIGSHLVRTLKSEGFWVRGVDLKRPEFSETPADDFVLGDLRNRQLLCDILDRRFDEVYQLAADMGGAGYIFTGEHDADVMQNSAVINLNVCNAFTLLKEQAPKKIFYSSSACMYPQDKQTHDFYRDNDDILHENTFSLKESDAYPANPDSEYGWEKLFSERLYLAYQRNYNLNVRIARFHNI